MNDDAFKKLSEDSYQYFVSLGRPPKRNRHEEFVYKAGFCRGAALYKEALDHLMEEIGVLRGLECSYDSEEEIMAEVFLKLNQLCGN